MMQFAKLRTVTAMYTMILPMILPQRWLLLPKELLQPWQPVVDPPFVSLSPSCCGLNAPTGWWLMNIVTMVTPPLITVILLPQLLASITLTNATLQTVHQVRDLCTYIRGRHGLAEQFLTGGLAMYCRPPRPRTDWVQVRRNPPEWFHTATDDKTSSTSTGQDSVQVPIL